jgi:sulfatase maturation enzyme AslB (radical SAM superfamily)
MKILCVGNNTEDSDHQSRKLADARNLQYHGLISDLEEPWTDAMVSVDGVYHSTPVDCNYQRLLYLADLCDEVVVLDQPRESFEHPDSWMQIYRLRQDTHTPVRSNTVMQNLDYWHQLLDNNKSFCILPWVEYMAGDAADARSVKLCCRSNIRIDNDHTEISGWQSDQRFVPIRQAMLAGQKLPHCTSCYQQEQHQLTSDRWTETIEWTNRLGLTSINALTTITSPAYVEIRSSNRCNLMCRMCDPGSSHRIADEYHRLGFTDTIKTSAPVDIFSEIDAGKLRKLYVSGGEPLLNNDFFRWLDRCSQSGSTDIECLINTNGTKLPMRLRRHLPHWPNMQFIFSIDAYDQHNHYIRWPSDWNSIVKNWHYLVETGHRVHVNTTVSIYNVHRLSALYRFIDSVYPDTLLHVNLVNEPDHLDFALFPNGDLAKQDIDLALACRCVKNNPLVGETLRFVQRTVSTRSNDDMLAKFFDFNDALDASRNIALKQFDSILDSYRK